MFQESERLQAISDFFLALAFRIPVFHTWKHSKIPIFNRLNRYLAFAFFTSFQHKKILNKTPR
jgi:hypothetical protein